jgi:capsular polysaccharide biosynthesis protein
MIESCVSPPLTFHNVTLEELDFAEQVRLFASAVLVVGQHGAGLGNSLWMQPGSTVIELTHRPRLKHFQNISRGMGHEHLLHLTTGPHAAVDVDALRTMIARALLEAAQTNAPVG